MAAETNTSHKAGGDAGAARERAGRHSQLLRRLVIPLLIFCVGAALTVLSYYQLRTGERRHRTDHFRQVAAGPIASVDKHPVESELVVNSVASFLATSVDLRQGNHDGLGDELQALADNLLADKPYFQALGWAMRVSGGNRASHDEFGGEHLAPTMQISEWGPEGHLRPATQRDEYYPILHLQSPQTDGSVAGYDLGSQPLHRAMLDQARDTGLAVTVGQIDWPDVPGS